MFFGKINSSPWDNVIGREAEAFLDMWDITTRLPTRGTRLEDEDRKAEC